MAAESGLHSTSQVRQLSGRGGFEAGPRLGSGRHRRHHGAGVDLHGARGTRHEHHRCVPVPGYENVRARHAALVGLSAFAAVVDVG